MSSCDFLLMLCLHSDSLDFSGVAPRGYFVYTGLGLGDFDSTFQHRHGINHSTKYKGSYEQLRLQGPRVLQRVAPRDTSLGLFCSVLP